MPEIELLDRHSVMKIRYGTVSEKLADRDTISPYMAQWMKTYYGLDETNYQGAAKDVYQAHCRRVRSGGFGLADYSRLSDAQITDDWSYLCFPNTSWNMMSEGGAAYRYRPHPTDPDRCFFDLSLFRFPTPGVEMPKVRRKVLAWDADLAVEMPEMPQQGALAIAQDMANVGFVQKGMHSSGFKGLILGKPEIRLRHFYQNIDRYLADTREI